MDGWKVLKNEAMEHVSHVQMGVPGIKVNNPKMFVETQSMNVSIKSF